MRAYGNGHLCQVASVRAFRPPLPPFFLFFHQHHTESNGEVAIIFGTGPCTAAASITSLLLYYPVIQPGSNGEVDLRGMVKSEHLGPTVLATWPRADAINPEIVRAPFIASSEDRWDKSSDVPATASSGLATLPQDRRRISVHRST